MIKNHDKEGNSFKPDPSCPKSNRASRLQLARVVPFSFFFFPSVWLFFPFSFINSCPTSPSQREKGERKRARERGGKEEEEAAEAAAYLDRGGLSDSRRWRQQLKLAAAHVLLPSPLILLPSSLSLPLFPHSLSLSVSLPVFFPLFRSEFHALFRNRP